MVSPIEENEKTQSLVASGSHCHQKLERQEVVLLELRVQVGEAKTVIIRSNGAGVMELLLNATSGLDTYKSPGRVIA